MKLNNTPACLALALTALGSAQVAHAQESGAGGPPPPPMERPHPPNATGRSLPGLGPVLDILSPEQRTSVTQALEAQREKLHDLDVKLRAARKELFDGALGGKLDEAALRQQSSVIGRLETELAVIRAQALAQVHPPLSPAQIEKMKSEKPAGAPPEIHPLEQPGRRRILSTSPDMDNPPVGH